MLTAMQREFEKVATDTEGLMRIDIPCIHTSHVFTADMSSKIARAIARVMESERYSIFNNHQ